jgi:predicted metal-dependent phosphoesterase TrpH
MKKELLKVELHCHSCYSKDSNLRLERLVVACRRAGVDVVALTDHNDIAGAMRLRELAPEGLTVIVGEEIATADGDLIGLFLHERIAPRLPILETIGQIRAQGGLVMVPHPFDRLRHEAMGGAVLERIKDDVDFVETFNARCVFAADNEAAAQFVAANGLHGYVCSDAHWRSEYGNATCLIEPFTTATEFAQNLRRAKFETKRANMLVHAGTAVVKRVKKMHRRLQGPAR